MGGMAVIPTVPCTGLRTRIKEENYQLGTFYGMIKNVSKWDAYRLGDDKILEDLQEQKNLIEKILKELDQVSS